METDEYDEWLEENLELEDRLLHLMEEADMSNDFDTECCVCHLEVDSEYIRIRDQCYHLECFTAKVDLEGAENELQATLHEILTSLGG